MRAANYGSRGTGSRCVLPDDGDPTRRRLARGEHADDGVPEDPSDPTRLAAASADDGADRKPFIFRRAAHASSTAFDDSAPRQRIPTRFRHLRPAEAASVSQASLLQTPSSHHNIPSRLRKAPPPSTPTQQPQPSSGASTVLSLTQASPAQLDVRHQDQPAKRANSQGLSPPMQHRTATKDQTGQASQSSGHNAGTSPNLRASTISSRATTLDTASAASMYTSADATSVASSRATTVDGICEHEWRSKRLEID
ncbi:hypothetical protein FQA39_LY19313 [Lamprigera yunnana]|nr:hypothetical protein FQA39_LY19313 [Lamprigera yunnana]